MTGDDRATEGQLTDSAARVYDEFFVPALFDQWPQRVLDGARVDAGDDVLDVGCGTGILARIATARVGSHGSVTGVDLNPGMLAVARAKPEPVVWRQGSAEDLPFPDQSFDRVVSQFALMFFSDRAASVAEIARVLRPDGRIAIATWASVEESPGYAVMVDLLRRLFGEAHAAALLAPFDLGTTPRLRALLEPVFADVEVARHEGNARFESIEAWVHTDVRGWTLADMIDDDQYAQLLAAATTELTDFVDRAGRVSFPAPALIGTAGRQRVLLRCDGVSL